MGPSSNLVKNRKINMLESSRRCLDKTPMLQNNQGWCALYWFRWRWTPTIPLVIDNNVEYTNGFTKDTQHKRTTTQNISFRCYIKTITQNQLTRHRQRSLDEVSARYLQACYRRKRRSCQETDQEVHQLGAPDSKKDLCSRLFPPFSPFQWPLSSF